MNGLTRFFLVLLRLAIGWHFLFEGIEKVESVNRGPTQTSRPFSSEGYLREGTGPVGEFMRGQIGDFDQIALARLTLRAPEPDEDVSKVPPRRYLSPQLDETWNDYFQRFAEHYQLSTEPRVRSVYMATLAFSPHASPVASVPWAALLQAEMEDPVQFKLAQSKLDQAKDRAALWLRRGVKEVERSLPGLSVRVTKTTPERIQEYRDKVQQLTDIESKELPAFDRDVERERLRSLKAAANRLRVELLRDLTQIVEEPLQGVLSEAQKKLGPLPDVSRQGWEARQLEWIDWLTRWGLVAVGLCLLFGLFTRTACLGGALFLLMLYLTMPPFPWVPEATRVEGHYYYVNKNLVEMLALLTLATTRSGRWLGLDGLVQFLNPWRWRARRRNMA